MTLSDQVALLAAAAGAELHTVHTEIGTLADLDTTMKESLVGAVNEVYGIASAPTSYSYVHHQLSPASTWEIVHNLGWRPNVQVFDSGGSEFSGSVVHESSSKLVITFTAGGMPAAFSGNAYLS